MGLFEWISVIIALSLALFGLWAQFSTRISTGGTPPLKNRIISWIGILSFLISASAFIIAFSPVHTSQKISDHAAVFLVDVSFSMFAKDISPDRITAVSQALSKALPSFPDSQYGITIFAGKPFPLVPLTPFPEFLSTFITALSPFNIQQTQIAGLSGTAIGEALISALKQVQGKKYASIIILTDGDINAGLDPRSLKNLLEQYHVKLHLIAFGTHNSPELSFYDEQGNFIQPIDPNTGQATRVKTNFELLKSISKSLGGTYFSAQNESELMSVITSIVSTFPKVYQDNIHYTSRPKIPFLLCAGIFFLLTLGLLMRYSSLQLIYTYSPESFLHKNSRPILTGKIILGCICALLFILNLVNNQGYSGGSTIGIIDRTLSPQLQQEYLQKFLSKSPKDTWIGIADNLNGGRILIPPTKDLQALKNRFTYEQSRVLQVPSKQTGIHKLPQSHTQFQVLDGSNIPLENSQNTPMILGILLYLSLCFPVLKFWSFSF